MGDLGGLVNLGDLQFVLRVDDVVQPGEQVRLLRGQRMGRHRVLVTQLKPLGSDRRRETKADLPTLGLRRRCRAGLGGKE